MSGQISGFDGINPDSEWFAVQITDNTDDYLNGNDLIHDFKFSDELIVIKDDNMSLTTTAPDAINSASTLMTVDSQRRGPPDRNIVDTHCINFTVEISSNDTNKKKYLYSHRLNRIYVDMECDFSVQFNWDAALIGGGMWVRACVVFADEAQAQKRPECCLQHLHQGSNIGLDEHIAKNVLHSSRPMGTAGVEYHGCADAADSWLSTVVAINKPGPEPVAHAYKFVCKSSCSSGINRRAIAIIFTLEDMQGVPYGRQIVGARVCSCVRRDMLKDEESEGVSKSGKKRAAGNTSQSKQKKIKVESTESSEPVAPPATPTSVYNRVELRMVTLNPEVSIAGVEVMLRMSKAYLTGRAESELQEVKELIAEHERILKELKDKYGK